MVGFTAFFCIANIILAPITDAGIVCSSLNFSPLLSLPLPPGPAYSNLVDLYLKGAAIFIIPVVA